MIICYLDRKSPKVLIDVVLKLSIACMILAVVARGGVRGRASRSEAECAATFLQLRCQPKPPEDFCLPIATARTLHLSAHLVLTERQLQFTCDAACDNVSTSDRIRQG